MSRQRNALSPGPGGACSVAFLVAAARSRVKQATGTRAAPLKLTPTQVWALFGLVDGGPMPLGTLAARVFADAPTMSRVIETLAARGLVACACDETDRRRTVVTLTAEGERVGAEAVRIVEEVRAEAVAGLDDDELAALRALLGRVIANLDKA